MTYNMWLADMMTVVEDARGVHRPMNTYSTSTRHAWKVSCETLTQNQLLHVVQCFCLIFWR
jgi:hypothetical protein